MSLPSAALFGRFGRRGVFLLGCAIDVGAASLGSAATVLPKFSKELLNIPKNYRKRSWLKYNGIRDLQKNGEATVVMGVELLVTVRNSRKA